MSLEMASLKATEEKITGFLKNIYPQFLKINLFAFRFCGTIERILKR